MKITIKLLSKALLATAALACPIRISRTSQSLKKISHHDDTNWAGAVLAAPAGESFYAIIGSFVVPELSPPTHSGAEGEWSGSTWVGIDGWGDSKLMQAGIAWNVYADKNGNLTRSYQAWHEWLPNGATNFDGFEINAGDMITVLVEVNSASSGWCIIQNESTNLGVGIKMAAPNNASFIVGKTAEWIVEDFQSGGFMPFANFLKVEWTNCKADSGPAGFTDGITSSFSPGDSTTLVGISQKGVSMTSTVTSGNNVTIIYIA
jgi:hypothetical protein